MIALPWMRFRKIVLFSIFIDYFLASYSCSFFLDKDYGANSLFLFNKFLFPIFWIFILYLSGRYNPIYLPRKSFKTSYYINHSLKIYSSAIFILYLLKLTLFSKFLIFNGINNIIEFREISIVIFFINLLGIFIQRLIITYLRLSHSREQTWWVQGNIENLNLLSKYKNTSYGVKSLKFIQMPESLSDIKIEKLPFGLIITEPLLLKFPEIDYIKSLSFKGLNVQLISDWMEFNFQKLPSQVLSELDIIVLSFEFISNSIQYKIKRIGDIIFSLILFTLFFPLLLVAALVIKLNDGGPVLYTQDRSGFDGKIFKIYKLRTMVVDAEKNGIKWSKKNDIRVTTIGSLLRKIRLDEFPQLFNVLKGDMSLIGPRPERPEIERDLVKKIPYYSLRNRMLPGLSGWAQVNYPYGASIKDSEEKLSFDLYYLRHFSIWLDFLIMFKTIRLLSNGEGSEPK